MKKLLVSTWSVRATAAVVFLVGLAAGARGNPSTVGVSYVDCLGDPNCTVAQLSSSDKAGVDPYIAYNWNTVLTAAGVQTNLIRDDLGVASVTNATVLWSATNTWSSTGRGEENNNFAGPDRVLMTGYLDQNTLTPSPTFIQIRDIPADMALNYDVVIYTLGGVPNRGGEYAVFAVTRFESGEMMPLHRVLVQ